MPLIHCLFSDHRPSSFDYCQRRSKRRTRRKSESRKLLWRPSHRMSNKLWNFMKLWGAKRTLKMITITMMIISKLRMKMTKKVNVGPSITKYPKTKDWLPREANCNGILGLNTETSSRKPRFDGKVRFEVSEKRIKSTPEKFPESMLGSKRVSSCNKVWKYTLKAHSFYFFPKNDKSRETSKETLKNKSYKISRVIPSLWGKRTIFSTKIFPCFPKIQNPPTKNVQQPNYQVLNTS